MSKVFVFGYYGYYNMGDEASLGITVDMIRKVAPHTEIDVLTYRHSSTSAEFGVNGISRNHLLQLINSIRTCDLVISGGGSLLQNVTSNRSLYYYLSIIAIAKLFRKPVIFYSNGFGPIYGSRGITKRLISKVDQIIVRDTGSRNLMRDIGITSGIAVTADVTFSLTKPAVIKPEGRRLVVALRNWHGQERYLKGISKAVADIAGAGYEVVFIPMDIDSDISVIKKVQSMLPEGVQAKMSVASDYGEALKIIAQADIVLGMRLHSLIFGLVCNLPVICLDYDPKVAALAKDFHMPLISLKSDNIRRDIVGALNAIERDYGQMKIGIREKTEARRASLSLNIEVLERYLKK